MAGPGNVLVTGGAGHGGSHVRRLLAKAGRGAVVRDTLSARHAWAVPGGALVAGDLGDRGRLAALVAGNAGVHEVLGWRAQQDDLEFAVRTAWTWKQTLQARRAGPPPVAS